ncbi:hypothetical protein IWQ47_001297 [Aquimarina sp. EL_43]|uniref:hypothetical protein n=1 Tax=unclassified Aquimarina TaxID=2627091 RepID=UPI000D6E235D|nr:MULTISPECIES: hypothetical protein [unclassified Aquimarina]MBG6129400.1 hypothetical protein [Aquimarina sp. EL_35]MBG6150465.1 hypothetical protein [Aquimarina sp. EL_32]MBG6168227.1 hypothetical protein [Aquimarina sp. EL_43]
MEFMEIKDKQGITHYINPSHISAICEIDGECKINLMGQEYMITQDTLKEVKLHLTSFRH